MLPPRNGFASICCAKFSFQGNEGTACMDDNASQRRRLTGFTDYSYNSIHCPIKIEPASAVSKETPVPVQMELRRIIISEVHEQQVILLREVDGERTFSIMIGIFEATSIDRRVKKMPSPRPLTHDLVANVIENLGGELRDIFISVLREHTYYAKLRIRQNGELIEVDTRPSDAIALAV